MKPCMFCGRETENAQWVDGHYDPLCFACEEELERMSERAERLPSQPESGLYGEPPAPIGEYEVES